MFTNEESIEICKRNMFKEEHIIYLNKPPKEKKSDYNFKRLLQNDYIEQFQAIRLGIFYQKYLRNIVHDSGIATLYDENLVQLFEKTKIKNKGKKDVDLCFIIDKNIYYFEVKTNLYLDTEKTYVSDKKMRLLSQYISDEYKDYNLISGCLTGWYEYEKGMTVRPHGNVVYMGEFYSLIKLIMKKEDHMDLLLELGTKIKPYKKVSK